MRPKQKRKDWQWIALVLSIMLLVGVFVMVVSGTGRLADAAVAEGAENAENAIRRAAVLCYATEGFYPPGLEYIEKEYGVQVDYSRYAVQYDVFASNILPRVQVKVKNS